MSSVPYQHLRNNDGWVSPHGWSAEHDVIHELVPFEHFNADPWAQLAELQDYLKGLPEHKSTWRWHGAPEMHNLAHYDQRERLFRNLLGAWPYRSTSGRSVFVNPYYDQLESVTWQPDEPKVEHWLRMALLGKWTTRDCARRYQNHPKTVYDAFKSRSMPFGDVQAYGRRRLANTVRLTVAWTDLSRRECCRRLGVPSTTMRGWEKRHGTLETVPERPSEQGFGSGW